jgi:hypothetical protein
MAKASVKNPIITIRDALARLSPGKPAPHHPHAGYHHPAGTGGDAVAPRHHGHIGNRPQRKSRGV